MISGLQVIFLLLAVLTIGSAIMMVISRKIMHAALWLIASFLGVAGVFATLESSFFAIVQIVVYIGAIAILIIFAIMLTRQSLEGEALVLNTRWPLALIVAACAALSLILVGLNAPGFFEAVRADGGESIEALGRAFVDPQGFLIPFETASILLIAAMIGAVYIAGERKG